MKVAIQFFKTSSKSVLEGLRFYYFTIKNIVQSIKFTSITSDALITFIYFSPINTILNVLDASHSMYAVDDQSDATNKQKDGEGKRGFIHLI